MARMAMASTTSPSTAGDDTGRDENPDDEALELAEENLQRADALAFLQFVRAVSREALCCFRAESPVAAEAKMCQHFLGRLAVPGFCPLVVRRWRVPWSCGDSFVILQSASPYATFLKSISPRSTFVLTNCTRSLLPTSMSSKPLSSLPSMGGCSRRTHVPLSAAPVTMASNCSPILDSSSMAAADL